MFNYCKNNPILYEDTQGDSATLAGGISGGIFGFLGALLSELSDDDEDNEDNEDNEGIRWDKVWECTLSSAAAGAASGFAADVSIATFGVAPAIFISAGFGAFFSGCNSAYVQYTLSGDIDGGKVVSDAILGGVTNGLCTGTSSSFRPVVKGVSDGFVYAWGQFDAELIPGVIDTGKFFVNDFLPTLITGFGAWFGGIEYDLITG